jgi:ribosomal protein S18 acetylase RimI-like enzyme
MDEAGRAAIREMRAVSQYGPLMWIFSSLDRLAGGLEDGFVWLEDGRLVGNVSVSPANYPRSLGVGHVIANVAVHPEFRRRGLAYTMMEASLDLIDKKGGKFAVLTVDEANDTARRLYSRLGFREERTFIRWHRHWHLRPPQRLAEMPFMTLLQPNEWRAEYELAQLTHPNSWGGLGWLRPLHPNLFRPSWWRNLGGSLLGRSEEHWIIRRENGRGLIGSLRATIAFGSPDRLELLVHPFHQGKLEEPLLNSALRRLGERNRSITMEHPADDQITTDILTRYGFERRHTVVHMRYDIDSDLH